MTALVLLTACLVSGCNDDDDNASKAKAVLCQRQQPYFRRSGGDSPDYHSIFRCPMGSRGSEWITVSPATGEGITEVTVCVIDNPSAKVRSITRGKLNWCSRAPHLASRSAVVVSQRGDNYRDCTQYTPRQSL